MQYKNPIDIELVNAASEAYDVLMNLCERIGVNVNTGIPLRLKSAVDTARTEMQHWEELDRTDLVSAVTPPVSMD